MYPKQPKIELTLIRVKFVYISPSSLALNLRYVMSSLLNYSWFIVIPFGLINVVFVYWRALSHLNRNELLKRRAFIAAVSVAVALSVTSLLVGTIQLMGGFENPFYVYSVDISNPYILAGKLVLLLFWVIVLVWSWLTDGLISYAKLFFFPMTALQKTLARWGATCVALFGIAILALYHGSAIPIIVNNYNGEAVEWITLQYEGGETTIKSINPKTRAVMSIKPNRVSTLNVSFKLVGQDSANQANLPLVLSDVAMGYIDLFVTKEGQLGLGEHLMFN